MISNALRQEQYTEYMPPQALRLDFRKLQLFDKEWVDSLLKAEDSLSSVGCFGTLYVWGEAYGQKIAKLGSRLIQQYEQDGAVTFAYPSGKGDLRVAVLAMREAAQQKNVPFVLQGLTEEQKNKLEEAFPGRFTFEEDRDSADYIYDAQALSTLAGNKLHGKRNHCNRFMMRYPEWRFEPLAPEHFQACRDLLAQWEAAKDTVSTNEQAAEPAAIEKAFAAYDVLNLDGGVLFVGDTPVAFTLGERTGKKGFDVRFEKADTAYDGSYPMINREFVRHLLEKYPDLQYINREEDMGQENLRKAKLSYKPAQILMKYTASWQ